MIISQYQHYEAFKALLQQRPEPITVAQLLQKAGVERSHGTQVLQGLKLGARIRVVLMKHLTPQEIEVLGWTGWTPPTAPPPPPLIPPRYAPRPKQLVEPTGHGEAGQIRDLMGSLSKRLAFLEQ